MKRDEEKMLFCSDENVYEAQASRQPGHFECCLLNEYSLTVSELIEYK